MLKAIQILGSSSVFVSQRWKYHNSCGFSIISCSCSSSRTPTMTSLVMPTSPTRKMRCFRAFRASTIRAESNPDALLLLQHHHRLRFSQLEFEFLLDGRGKIGNFVD
ncbi:hypothetical protein CK203_077148 [Vitis vinifera]|uniref:Uncharacterized protein n=1 Tax=Vitis vinifera TaxID=29760 RepID=A0A438D5K1_VITVI|nr:hypothetical protein CK203_077148 [Vitis vinifera]